jgi:hypothetical protein
MWKSRINELQDGYTLLQSVVQNVVALKVVYDLLALIGYPLDLFH